MGLGLGSTPKVAQNNHTPRWLAGQFGSMGMPAEAAAVIAVALYQGLSTPAHCHHILLQTVELPPSSKGSNLKDKLHNAMLLFSKHGDLGLNAQLTTLACLAHLCAAEVASQQHTMSRSRGGCPWLAAAQRNRSFEAAAHIVMTACEVCNASAPQCCRAM